MEKYSVQLAAGWVLTRKPGCMGGEGAAISHFNRFRGVGLWSP